MFLTNNKKYIIQKAEELIENGLIFNHKVVSIEVDGYEDVYNGTVDDFHNFAIVLNAKQTKNGRENSRWRNLKRY